MLRFLVVLFFFFISANSALCDEFPRLDADFDKSFEIQPFDPRFSGRIAFAAKIQGFDRILVLDLDGRKIRRAVDWPGNNTYPSFSPDGTKLAFTSDRDGKKAIYIADWDGGSQKRLTDSKEGQDSPAWSPDGKLITFNSEIGQGENTTSNIFMAEVETGKVTQLTKMAGKNSLPRFNSDGTSVTYNTNRFWPGWDICSWNIKAKVEKCPLGGNASYCRAAWSNSGRKLALSEGTGEKIDIMIFDPEKKSKDQLSEQVGKDYDASWSPDDSHLLYVSELPAKRIFNLFVAEVEGKKTQPLLLSSNSIRYPSWSKAKTLELEARRIVDSGPLFPLEDHQ